MLLDITIQADSTEPFDMAALAALIAALGGRAPAALPVSQDTGDIRTVLVDRQIVVDHSDEDADIVSAAVATGAPTHDSAGVPWDERIHSASRATVGNGTWRRRKNTPDETYDAVMTELTAGNDVPLPPTEATKVDTPETPSPSTLVDTAPEAAVADSVADVPSPPTETTGPDLSSWPKFVQSVQTKDVPESAKAYANLNVMAEALGVAKFLDLRDQKAQWAMFYEMVG